MEELDELKSIWRHNDASFQPKDEAEIARMLTGSSRSIVDKLKRSVWFELIVTLVTGVVLLSYALTLSSGALKWTSVAILAVFMVYTIYYIKKITMLNRFNPATENLRETLERLTDNLSSYLKVYKSSYTILYPMYFGLGLLFGALERGMDKFIELLVQPRTLVYLAILAGVFFFCSTWLANWYLKKLYGNHLEKLKGLLHDLQEK
jgi:hypothetical protein